MAEKTNTLSANLSIDANGPNSTTDHEYDSGKMKLRWDNLQWIALKYLKKNNNDLCQL